MTNNKIALHQNKDWLYEQYVVQKRTLKDIGIETGSSWGTIGNWCKKFQIPLRNPHDITHIKYMQHQNSMKRKLPVPTSVVAKLYLEQGLTIKEIATQLNYGWDTIRRRCIEMGLPIRPAKIRNTLRAKKAINALHRNFCDTKNLKKFLYRWGRIQCWYPACHYYQFLDIHHISGTNIKRSGRKHSKNTLDNVVLLCPNHHREADFGQIPKETLLQINNHETDIIKEKVRTLLQNK